MILILHDITIYIFFIYIYKVNKKNSYIKYVLHVYFNVSLLYIYNIIIFNLVILYILHILFLFNHLILNNIKYY